VSRIKVLFIAPHLDGGGTERVLINLINNFDPETVAVELLLYKKGGSLADNLKKGIKVSFLDSRPRYSLLELSSFLRKNNFDLLFPTKHYLLLIVLAARYISRKKIPVVYREITHISTELKLNFSEFSLRKLYNNRFLYKQL